MKKIEYLENKKIKKTISLNNIDNDYINDKSYFPIASITKIFTIYIILILQEKKKLNINDSIEKYIKSSNINDFSKIKIIDLINHTSGIKNFPDSINYDIKTFTATVLTNIIINEDLFKFKKTFKYSNIGYILLGYIIEKVTKMNYMDAYYKYIFKPLNMTTYVGSSNIKIYNTQCKELDKKDIFYINITSTAGAFMSNITDLIKFSKNSIKLLNNNSRNILKKLYIYKNNKIQHNGDILGNKTRLEIVYKNWKPIHIYIKLSTCN